LQYEPKHKMSKTVVISEPNGNDKQDRRQKWGWWWSNRSSYEKNVYIYQFQV